MDITFESKTILEAVKYFLVYKAFAVVMGFAIFLVVFQFVKWIVRWFISEEKNYFNWFHKRDDSKFHADVNRWEHEIDNRVAKLDEIKRLETAVRNEVDALYRVKAEKDKR